MRIFSTATEVVPVITAATPIISAETCNWPQPVPYSQLTVGVPREILEGNLSTSHFVTD